MREILFIVGEPSGDLHASNVARELKMRGLPLSMSGIGGDLMEAAGVRLEEHIRGMAVLGLVEVLRHVPKHWRMLARLRERFESGSVALVVLVDYPGFNMRVAQAAAEAGVPVLYYIVPQVWAWGEGRLEKMARWVRKAAVILPFEESLLRAHGVEAEFVGHPLLDRAVSLPSRKDARRLLGLPEDAPVLALFPGSRSQEIARHLDPFVSVANELKRQRPQLQVVVSAAPDVSIDEARCPFPVVRSSSLPLLRAANAALCKSGTTTLEAAVAGCPHVIGYRTHPLTYFAAKRVVKVPNIGLVNVVAGARVVPEFIQDDFSVAAVAASLAPLLDEAEPRRRQMIKDLETVRSRLGEPGAAARVATIAEGIIEGVR